MRSPKPIARVGKRPLGAHLTQRPLKAGGTNIVPLAEKAHAFGVIEGNGTLLVRLRDPRSKQGLHELDLTGWLARRPLALAIADYLATWGARVEAGRRAKVDEALRVFRAYLDFRDESALSRIEGLSDLSTEVVAEYQVWLDAQRSKPRDGAEGAPWSPMTKAARYNAVKEFVEHCRGTRRYGPEVSPDLVFRRNPWPGRHRTVQSREALSALQVALIRKACISELPKTIEQWTLGAEVAANNSIRVPPAGSRNHASFAAIRVRLKTILTRYNGRILPREELSQRDPGLARSMIEPHGSVSKTGAYLYPTARALVPFIVLLAIAGSFNPEGLLTLAWADVERTHPIFGEERWRIAAQKRRADRAHYRSFPTAITALENPVSLLLLLDQHKDLVRSLAPDKYKERVFLFWQTRGEPFTSFDDVLGAASDKAWTTALTRFIDDHGLEPFTLSQFRPTGSDFVHQMTGGDIKAQQTALGHASITGTERGYLAGPAKQRAREALAEAMAWRDRFLSTEGRADTRGGRLATGKNTAATPGFGCFEPMFSPIAGQREGKLCSAYGLCAACPLAWVNVSDPKALVRLRQLRQQIEDARSRINPVRWLEAWQPQLAELDRIWLPAFPTDVAAEAVRIVLPPLPPLE